MLEGIRVLDLSRLLPGPFATEILAELGADVTKVEPPGGDRARAMSPDAHAIVNARKRIVTIDLRSPDGIAEVLRLASESDALVDSFRPGVLDAMGLSADALARANPRLVHVSLVGYPPGERRDEPGHDINYQALAGALPDQPGAVLVADVGGALYGAVAVLAALVERGRTGRGRRVEVALADAALAMNVVELADGGVNPLRGGALPCYHAYACRDGERIALGAIERKFWDRFVEAARRPDLAPAHLDPDAVPRIEALFRERDAAEWLALLRAAGVPATPVRSSEDARLLPPGGPVRPAR